MAKCENTLYRNNTKRSDIFMLILIYLAAAIAVVLVMGIIVYCVVHGISVINWEFLTKAPSFREGTLGIGGNILNTLYVIFMTLIIAVPLGIGAAIYLNEYAKPGKFVNLVTFTTETLAGIPSIIFGLFGMKFFGEYCGLGFSIINGALTLSIMIFPLITRNTQEALKTVPNSYREGALGMGVTKWHMIRTILLPSAIPGIITGIILSIGRIVGESAALLFTAGSGEGLPETALAYVDKIGTSGGTLAIQLYLSMAKADYASAYGIAVVLLVIVLAINFIAKIIGNHFNTQK